MLQTVIRPSIERARIASPANSTTWPVPPAVPISPMMARMISLAVTPSGGSPSTRTSMFFIFCWISVWVARTCSTSDVPMPCASAPNAPCVAVWLSPQTIVMPGRVNPCSGPTMWTMPCRWSSSSKYSTPNSAAFLASASTWMRLSSLAMPLERSPVVTLWSTTASVRAGLRTFRPATRRPSKACGLVTSCTRWRST